MKLKTLWWIPVLCLGSLSGCLELMGQRIAWHHDEAADRLYLLLHYDGIHDSEREERRDAEGDLRQAVEHGELMLLDWFGHVDFRALADRAADRHETPAWRVLSKAIVDSTSTRILGHYQDPNGQIGVAQLVVIERVSELIRVANRAISAELATWPDLRNKGWDHTLELMAGRALGNPEHPWLALDGQSLVFRTPIDATELTRGKLEFLAELARGKEERGVTLGQAAVAALPFSFVQADRSVEVRVGDSDRHTGMRCAWNEGYRPNLDELVRELVPESLDARLANHLLGGPPDETIASIASWSLPEDRVRAVLAVIDEPRDPRRAAALDWLAAFSERWQGDRAFPVAPEPTNTSAWRVWYAELADGPAR